LDKAISEFDGPQSIIGDKIRDEEEIFELSLPLPDFDCEALLHYLENEQHASIGFDNTEGELSPEEKISPPDDELLRLLSYNENPEQVYINMPEIQNTIEGSASENQVENLPQNNYPDLQFLLQLDKDEFSGKSNSNRNEVEATSIANVNKENVETMQLNEIVDQTYQAALHGIPGIQKDQDGHQPPDVRKEAFEYSKENMEASDHAKTIDEALLYVTAGPSNTPFLISVNQQLEEKPIHVVWNFSSKAEPAEAISETSETAVSFSEVSQKLERKRKSNTSTTSETAVQKCRRKKKERNNSVKDDLEDCNAALNELKEKKANFLGKTELIREITNVQWKAADLSETKNSLKEILNRKEIVEKSKVQKGKNKNQFHNKKRKDLENMNKEELSLKKKLKKELEDEIKNSEAFVAYWIPHLKKGIGNL